MYYKSVDIAKASDSKGYRGLRVSYSVIRMIRYVSVMILDMMGYVVVSVRPAVQTLTVTLPIHFCISSTTYAITNLHCK